MAVRKLLALGLLAYAALPFAAMAREAPPPSSVPGWQAFVDSLQSLPERMLAKLPEPMRSDPQVQQEVARLAMEALAGSTIEAIGGDGDAPQFLPVIGQVLNTGQPNADTIYRGARLTPGASYRLRGTKGTLPLFVLAQVGTAARPHLDLARLKPDRKGRFDVLLSPEKPAGYKGTWWKLEPDARRLLLRMVSSDWAQDRHPTISIERTDMPVGRSRPQAATLEARLRALPGAIDFSALMFVDHVEQLRQQGFVNRLKVFDVPLGALAGQFYYEGVYDLADDEALIIDSPVPVTCDYRSLILTNELYETTDWVNNHSSLNDAQAAPDRDGRLRIIVSARDPGVKNWLDTAGHPKGIVQGRWTGCDSQPVPDVRKVKLTELLGALPADVATVTPQERQAILRERRRAFLERPQW